MLISNRLKNFGIIALVLGAHLIIPKASEVVSDFSQLLSQGSRAIAFELESSVEKRSRNDVKQQEAEEFKPPENENFYSEYGSGTR